MYRWNMDVSLKLLTYSKSNNNNLEDNNMVVNVATNRWATSNFIVAPTIAQGASYTTISAAITAAGSSGDIFIKPGTYTENITLPASINLIAYDGDQNFGSVTIVGKVTCTDAGFRTISNIRLQTNSDFALAVTGSAATVVFLKNCFLNCSNNTGVSFTSSNAASSIQFVNSVGDLATTGIAVFASSSAGTINFVYSSFGNTGNSVTANTISAGFVGLQYATFANPITTSGTSAILGANSSINCASINTTGLTVGGSTASNMSLCGVAAGTASAISISTTLSFFEGTASSSNTNAITGAGTLIYDHIDFPGTSFLINSTLTQTRRNVSVGGLSFDGGTNNIKNGTASILVASNAAGLIAQRALSTVIKTFTSNGTYTPTTGMLYCVVEMVGGGGGSGGCATCTAGQFAGSGAGGGGEYARGVFSAATIGASQAVTIGTAGTAGTAGANNGGAGGTTSLGALITAAGGGGGTGSAATASGINNLGGAGGTGGSGGSFRTPGGPGENGIPSFVALIIAGGQGGSSFFGGGARALAAVGVGNAGQNYGSGGGGSQNFNAAANAGAAGATGFITITEYVIN